MALKSTIRSTRTIALALLAQGVGGNGAIVNSGGTAAAVAPFYMTGDAALGGNNAWSVVGDATLNGNDYSLTKVGSNEVCLTTGQRPGWSSELSVAGVKDFYISCGTFGVTAGNNGGSPTVVEIDNSSPGSIYINSGGVLSVSNGYGGASGGVLIDKPIVMAGGTFQTEYASCLTGVDPNASIGVNISLNATGMFAPKAGAVITLNGSISDGTGSNGIAQVGAGTLILNGANTHSGMTTVSTGTLALGNALALQDGTLDTSGGGTISLGSLTAVALGGLQGSNAFALQNNSSSAVALTVGNNNSSTTFSGSLTGGGSLNKTGSGTLSLTGNNSFSGGTTISGGTLNIDGDMALGTAPASPATNVTFSGNGTLQAGAATVSLSGNRNIVINSGITATIDSQSNMMTVPSVVGGPGSLAKTGNGTLTLTANGTYSGDTTVLAGILQVTGSLANNNSANVFVAKDADGVFGDGNGDAVITRRVAASGGYSGLGSAITNLGTGELPTTADILDGNASAQADVSMAWRTRTAAEKAQAGGGLISEVLDLGGIAPSGSGTHDGSHQTDTFVLQMNYDPTQLISIWGETEAAGRRQ